jgi:hypothetical protein
VLTLDEINARPPLITASGKVIGGAFQLSGTGPHGAAYRVLASTNLSLPLSQWTQASTGRFSGGVFTSSDPQASNQPARFYRVAKP